MVPSSCSSIIYTDGSRLQQGVGAAYTVKYKDQVIFDNRIRPWKINLIYQAEYLAIMKAFDWFLITDFGEMIFYSDSSSSMQAVIWGFLANSIIMQIYDKLLYNTIQELLTLDGSKFMW